MLRKSLLLLSVIICTGCFNTDTPASSVETELTGYINTAAKAVRGHLENPVQNKFINLTPRESNMGIAVRFQRGAMERGCIAFFTGVDFTTINSVIKTTAIDAAFFDPRYPSVTKDELTDLTIEVTKFLDIKKIDNPLDFTLGTDSIVVEYFPQRALMQAQLALENNWTKEEFLAAICRKGGMPADTWQQDDVTLYRLPSV